EGKHGESGRALLFKEETGFHSHSFYGDVTGLPQGNSPRTGCIWLQIPSSPTHQSIIFAMGDSKANEPFGLFWWSGRFLLWTYNANHDTGIGTGDDNWHFVCLTMDSSNQARVFKDGLQIGSTKTFSPPLATTGTRLTIGRQGFGSPYNPWNELGLRDPMRGNRKIQDLYIFNRALSAAELISLETCSEAVGKSLSEIGQTVYYPFEGHGIDCSGASAAVNFNMGSIGFDKGTFGKGLTFSGSTSSNIVNNNLKSG
ncbi:MAG: LamG domain-containing protein, partial [bacterium]|nr:LamG domain-containing protein [bacterium]